MRDFLIEIGYETGPPTLYQDNNACIYAYKNSTLSTDHKEKWFTKNFIRNKLEFIRQLVSLDLIRVVYLNTKNHPADCQSAKKKKKALGSGCASINDLEAIIDVEN